MAIALTAWLMAPAPIAWTSTRLWLRTTPAMAPATATGFEVAETFRISIAARAVRGTPAAGLADHVRSFPVEPVDGGVGPEDEARPAVEVPAKRDLFRGSLRVHVHQPKLGAGPLAQHLVRRLKGRINGRHEELALDVADQDLALFPQVMAEPATAGRAGRVVVRAQDGSMLFESGHHLSLVPDVIP